MGLNFSTARKEYVIRQYTNPRVKQCENTFMVRMHYSGGDSLVMDNSNPFQGLVSTGDENQRIIIEGMYLLFVNNEFDLDLEVNVSNLFELPREHRNVDVSHPDDTAKISIVCPRRMNGKVSEMDAYLYRPKLSLETLERYAGLEPAILEPQSIEIPNETQEEGGGEGGAEQVVPEEMFEEGNPIVAFIMTHQEALKPLSNDFEKTEKENTNYYKISGPFLQRVRTFFQDTIFNDMRYTRFEGCKFECMLPEGARIKNASANLSFILQIKYLLVSPGDPRMRSDEIKL